MSNIVQQLKGSSITQAIPIEDYLNIEFSDGSVLSIFNHYTLKGDSTDFSAIAGSKLVAVDEQPKKITFNFSTRQKIEVDLSDDGFTGPEAMMLVIPNQPIVVWRADDC